MERSYEIRIYPNRAQREQIERTFGCCRWVYNKCLEARRKAWARRRGRRGASELMALIPKWKRGEAPFLADADSVALQQAVRDLDRAYGSFLAGRARHPRFKSKRDSRQSYRTQSPKGRAAVEVAGPRHLKLPKLGLVKARVSREVEGRVVNATVKRTPSGKYFCVLCCTGCPRPEAPRGREEVMGVDAGVHDLAVCSDGTRFPNPRNLAAAEKRLAREQRRLARRQKGSANRERQRLRVARAHEKVANRRRDALHKATSAIVRESQAVAAEDLNVRGMMSNRRLSKAASDASMGELLRQLEYKCAWHGRPFARVPRWFPSTRLCGCCGALSGPAGLAGLRERDWACPGCGAVHDRDLDAARNIAEEGRRVLKGTAGHAGTRAA